MKNKLKLILLTLLLMMIVVGCSAKKPSTVVEEYFTEVKKGQSAEASEYLLDSNDSTDTEENKKGEEASEDPIMEEAMNLYMSKMDVKILSENVEDDKATVEVELTGLNLSNMFLEIVQDSFANIFSGEEMSEIDMGRSMLEKVKNGKLETRTGKINLTKVDKNWKLSGDDDYNALIFGNPEMTAEKVK